MMLRMMDHSDDSCAAVPAPRRHRRAGTAARCGHRWAFVCGALLLAAGAGVPGVVSASATSSPIVLVGTNATSTYIAQRDTQSLLLVRRNGKIAASRHLDGTPAALALDAERGLLYVALSTSKSIAVLRSTSLQPVLTLHTAVTPASLAPVPGQNALYVFDTATRRTVHLSYSWQGAVQLAPLFASIKSPAVAQVHISLNPAHRARQAAGQTGTFWASGFRPGEPVSVSWGARNQGIICADRYGIVSADLPTGATALAGPHSLGLYGLSSHRTLLRVVMIGSRAHVRRHTSLPPLIMGMLPGPVATLSPPLLHNRFRVPVAAAALAALPLILVLGVLLRVRRSRRRPTPSRGRRPAAAGRRPAAVAPRRS